MKTPAAILSLLVALSFGCGDEGGGDAGCNVDSSTAPNQDAGVVVDAGRDWLSCSWYEGDTNDHGTCTQSNYGDNSLDCTDPDVSGITCQEKRFPITGQDLVGCCTCTPYDDDRTDVTCLYGNDDIGSQFDCTSGSSCSWSTTVPM